MHIALWVIASLLATAYFLGGGFKVVRPKEAIAEAAPSARWVEDFPESTVKAIGIAEMIGAVGLIVPAVTGFAPILVPIAASCLAVIMIGASITRYWRGEIAYMMVDLIYLACSLFVAWGRFGPHRFDA